MLYAVFLPSNLDWGPIVSVGYDDKQQEFALKDYSGFTYIISLPAMEDKARGRLQDAALAAYLLSTIKPYSLKHPKLDGPRKRYSLLLIMEEI